MMSPYTLSFAVSLLLMSLPGVAYTQGSEWQTLFDGTSLNGWCSNENPSSFQLKDGVLVVKGDRSHLFYEGDGETSFQNFILEAEVMTKKGANSGLFFHTAYQESGWPGVGYEIQVNNSHTDPIRTGSIYGVVKVPDPPAKDDKWFKLWIAVRRNNIAVKVDGKTLVNWMESRDVTGTRRLSRGTFAIQAHDPKSEVHYKSLKVRRLPDTHSAISRADRQLLKPEGPWYERMDCGPFLSTSIGVGRKNKMLKGLAIPLGDTEELTFAFDTELLRSSAWSGFLKMTGVTYDGSHGGHPRREGRTIFSTSQVPGWAMDGKFTDPRETPHGPLPKTWGRYRGLKLVGERVFLQYDVGGVPVTESPTFVQLGDSPAIVRTLEVAGRTSDMLLSLGEGRFVKSLSDNAVLVGPEPRLPAHLATGDRINAVADRSTSGWKALTMGPPVKGDLLERRKDQDAAVFFVDGWAKAHSKAGVEKGRLPRLMDGECAQNHDDVERCSWFDDKSARLMVRLGEATDLKRVNIYSWHKSNRAPLVFTMWGHEDARAGGMEENLGEAGWKPIGSVDTRSFGEGGQHGVCIENPGGKLGHYARLLLVTQSTNGSEGAFFTEVDVFSTEDDVPALKTPAHPIEVAQQSTLAVQGGDGVKIEVQDAPGDQQRAVLRIPAGEGAQRLRLLAIGRTLSLKDIADLPALGLHGFLKDMEGGGSYLWPETITVEAKIDSRGKGPYAVDDIPVPFENPYESYMRIGAFDFFSDGDRAALCTWNGDVWVVSGLNAMKAITWKRYATGLFETLGLKIVDDCVYVNGKDQITKLIDTDGNGEADSYECFNNDVKITDNFHEFTFDLQTDSDGNFYFSKAAPVLPGGRGFDPIVESHGTVMKLTRDGQHLSVYSRGMRAPNGIGVGPDGQITCGDNEGTWVPHCKLHWLKEGSFQGVIDVAQTPEKPKSFNPPLCWFPMEVDNSGGGQTWVTSDRWGPFTGDLLHLSYGQSSIYKVMVQDLGDLVQGAVVRIPVRLASSAMRGRFHPKDGQLWVSGLKGWQTNAAKLAGFQRIRRTNEPVRLPTGFEVLNDGIRLTFTCELDPELAEDPESYAYSHWNYVWSPQYGSPEVSVDKPNPEVLSKAQKAELHRHKVHDKVAVTEAKLEPGGRSVRLKIPGLKVAMQIRIKVDLESADGKEMRHDIYGTVNRIPGSGR